MLYYISIYIMYYYMMDGITFMIVEGLERVSKVRV